MFATIMILGISIFLSQVLKLNTVRTDQAKAIYAAQAGIYKAIVDYKNNGSISAETDTQITGNIYYSTGVVGGGKFLRIDASSPTIHGKNRKLKNIFIYNLGSISPDDDAVMDTITLSWTPDSGERLTKINFTGTGGNEWTGSEASGVEIALSYTFVAGGNEEFKFEWTKDVDDISGKTITMQLHFTDGSSLTKNILVSGGAGSDSISITATGTVVAEDTWKRTLSVTYDATSQEIMSWQEISGHI